MSADLQTTQAIQARIRQMGTCCERVVSTRLTVTEPFLQTASRFAGQPGTVALMSGGMLDCARYHLLGFDPLLTFCGRGRQLTLSARDDSISFEGSPLETLGTLTDCLSVKKDAGGEPMTTGLMGYLAYDLKADIERLPRTVIDDQRLPHILFYLPSMLLVQDKQVEGELHLHMLLSPGETPERRLDGLRKIIDGPAPPSGGEAFHGATRGFVSGFDRRDYLEAVERIRRYIAAGDVYQVNLSQRFETDFGGDPFALFQALYRRNPAPFFAFVNGGDHQVVSTSPERFVRLADRQVEARPIKGTRPRGDTIRQDRDNREALEKSPKDDAELSMIVDLLRNDIGKVCRPGSVRVSCHRRVEAYRNVYHLVSIVEGELDPGKTATDLIRATFPGGSITGCPKIRSMEIIDELEPVARHLYTGSIGYIGLEGTMDLSIAIRTATIHKERMVFSVGGGIVYDSDPAEEYDETLHKGKTLLSIFGDAGEAQAAADEGWVWFNGRLRRSGRGGLIDHRDAGLLHGCGFFETMRADRGRVDMLADHLDRFRCTWKAVFPEEPPDLTWHRVVEQVLSANQLMEGLAVVKILATAGPRQSPPYRRTLLVTAASHVPRPCLAAAGGLHLATYPLPRQTPLADYKTTNYLYYLQAGRWASRHGADEAVIRNPDGTLSETSTANLLLVRGGALIQPVSAHVLPGTMEKAVISLLTGRGMLLQHRPVWPEDLTDADQVLLTNSLMGAVPALSVDQKPLRRKSGFCREINHSLSGRRILP
jgi:para-aminobenzoate synthetase component 1